MRRYLKGGSVRPNFSMMTYESITLLNILTLKSTSPQQLQGQRGPSIFRISVPASSLITNLVEDGDDDHSDDDLGMKSQK